MKQKKWQRRLASLLSMVLLLGCLFTPGDQTIYALAGDANAADESVPEEGYEGVPAGGEQTEEEQPEEEQRMSLAELAGEYTVPEVLGGKELKIIYVSENGVLLREDYESLLAEAGNERITIGADGQMVQTFEENSEDLLAPMVYRKDGYFTRDALRWKVIYTKDVWIEGGYIDGRWVPGHNEKVTKTYTLSANTAVKKVQEYATNGIVRIYPNWDSASHLNLNFHSNLEPDTTKSISLAYGNKQFKVPGNRDKRLGLRNEGKKVGEWNIAADGSGEFSLIPHEQVDVSDLFVLASGSGITRTLDVYGQWEDLECRIRFDRNQGQLTARAEQVGESDVFVNEEEYPEMTFRADQTVSVNAYTSEQGGYVMLGWAFTADAKEPAITADALSKMTAEEVLNLKEEADPAEDDGENITLYAFWGFHEYSINYRGIRVRAVAPESGKDAAASDSLLLTAAGLSEEELESLAAEQGVFFGDSAQLEILGVEDAAPIGITLPTSYNIGENTVLPGPDEINLGQLDPEFSKEYDFICWTKNKWMRRDVRSLGKNGDVHDGDVILYAVYTPKQMTASVNEAQQAEPKEFKAIQINTPNLADRTDYAVIRLEGCDVHADMLSVSFNNGTKETDYYEICEVDSTKAKLGNGYATIGIRLKDSVSADKIKDARKAVKLQIKVRGINDPEGTEQTLAVWLKTAYKLPKFSADASSLAIHSDMLEKDQRAEFFLKVKKGALDKELLDGKWQFDFVDSTRKSVIDDVKVSLAGDKGIRLTASKEAKGFIRIHNTIWINGAYSYIPLTIKVSTQKAALKLSTSKVVLNNAYDTEEACVTVRLSDGMAADASKLSIATGKNWPEKGLSVSMNNGVIRIKGAKDVKKGSYKLTVSCEGMKKKTITVKVVDTTPEKALKFVVKGKSDAVYGGQLFLNPKIKGFSGDIVSARVVKESVSLNNADPECKRYEAYWNGAEVVLSATDEFKPLTEKMVVTVELTLSTGRTLTADVKIKPTKGKFVLKALNAVVSENSVSVPVMASYSWQFYYGAGKYEKRVSDFDLTKPETNEMIRIGDKDGKLDGLQIKGVLSASYKDGIITLNLDPAYKASGKKVYKLSLPAVWSVDGKTYKANFNITIVPKAE